VVVPQIAGPRCRFYQPVRITNNLAPAQRQDVNLTLNQRNEYPMNTNQTEAEPAPTIKTEAPPDKTTEEAVAITKPVIENPNESPHLSATFYHWYLARL